jgi:hypothetical protein
MKRGPRWWHHLRAEFGGYFWSPCRVCGRMWGGHEWGEGQTIWDRPSSGYGVCSKECAAQHT